MPHRHVSARRQQYVARYILPAGLGRNLHRLHPELTSLGPALRGLRQWLRIRILTDEPLGMPSVAVRSLWRDLTGRRTEFEDFCHHAYGRHRPNMTAAGSTPRQATVEEMARTWAMVCQDQHIRSDLPDRVPVLFDADQQLGLTEGQRWTLWCKHSTCRTAPGVHCVRHELIPAIPDDLPRQVHFDVLAAYPLIDKSFDGPIYPLF